MPRQILFITTSHAQLGDTGRATGLWAEEVAAPYLAFQDAGYEVVIASPRGGSAPIDPASIEPHAGSDATLKRFLADDRAQQRLQNTRPLVEVGIDGYDAVFFPGGHGAMWDLPGDANVARLVQAADAAGKVVGAVCHGVAGLVAARTLQGRPFVSGKVVNSFTDAEEDAAGLGAVVPFKLESRLRELGARFEGAPNWASFAVRDGRLVTGQNPASSARVAELMLEALRSNAARPLPASADHV